MKPLIQKLPLDDQSSFIAKVFRTPHFEVGWHQHIEYELILFTEGSGLGFVGNHVSEFETGDIYFLGANLPHTFQKSYPELITSAVVIQFREDFWGKDFLQLAELRFIKELFSIARQGLKITTQSKQQLAPLIKKLAVSDGFKRIILLGECLDEIAANKQYIALSTNESRLLNPKSKECIDKVFQFTIDRFKDPIRLSEVAAIACMSVPAFCSYFKRTTRKTYINFLNETRIGYACHLLLETRRPVPGIAYESGYNTKANFHKQFLKIKKTTPLQYRRYFTPGMMEKGTNIAIEKI